MNFSDVRKKVDTLLSKKDYSERRAEEERNSLLRARERFANAEEAQRFLQSIAQNVQENAHKQLASVVTRCLRAVFGRDSPEFRIDFQKKRGRTEAKLLFVCGGHEIDPSEDSSGGMIDVASFALRLACLMLARPRRRRLLVLDEPFKNVNGEEYQERAGMLLESLAKEMGIQMVIVTDDEWLKIGKEIRL